MTNVLILGAAGQIARVATRLFLETTDAHLTLYLRNARRLRGLPADRTRIVEGDVLDAKKLGEAMKGQNVVYANLSGDMEAQAKAIVKAMQAADVKRLIFISSMGIYGEVPGQKYRSVLDPYRNSAQVIEASDLDYTIIRPEWLNDRDEIDYRTTRKGQPFENPDATVSRKSVADLVVKLALTPGMGIRESMGVNKRIHKRREAMNIALLRVAAAEETAVQPARGSSVVTPTDDEALREAHREMIRAMLAARTDVLGSLLDEGYTLTHMTGRAQTKREWLSAIDSGQVRYDAAKESSVTVTVTGLTAVLVGQDVVTATIQGAHGRGTFSSRRTTPATMAGGSRCAPSRRHSDPILRKARSSHAHQRRSAAQP